MNNLQIFKNEEFGEVRTVEIDGTPWFVGKDITEKLEYQNGSRDIERHVDSEDCRQIPLFDGKQNRNVLVINESGLYALILSSTMPRAKEFKHWVTSEVLPQIRKTGSYHLPQSYKEALRELLIAVEENEKLALENESMKPKADFFDAVADSKDATDIANVAKVLNVPGYGRNNLFEFLRKKGILQPNNIPYQRYIDNGWFRVIEQKYQRDGMPCINFKTLVYQRGVDGIRKLLLKV